MLLRSNSFPFTQLDETFGRWLDDLFPAMQESRPRLGLNVFEQDDLYTVEAEVPGLTLDDLNLEIHGRELKLSGEFKRDAEKVRIHRQERNHGRFERSLQLPAAVDPERVSATLKHGVLTVTLPKAAAAQRRKIDIKCA